MEADVGGGLEFGSRREKVEAAFRPLSQTGYDAGNAGVLFVCTVPFVPPIAIALGSALGMMLDGRRDRSG